MTRKQWAARPLTAFAYSPAQYSFLLGNATQGEMHVVISGEFSLYNWIWMMLCGRKLCTYLEQLGHPAARYGAALQRLNSEPLPRGFVLGMTRRGGQSEYQIGAVGWNGRSCSWEGSGG